MKKNIAIALAVGFVAGKYGREVFDRVYDVAFRKYFRLKAYTICVNNGVHGKLLKQIVEAPIYFFDIPDDSDDSYYCVKNNLTSLFEYMSNLATIFVSGGTVSHTSPDGDILDEFGDFSELQYYVTIVDDKLKFATNI